MESRIKPKRFEYRTEVRWLEEREGIVSSVDKPSVPFASPPEFHGQAGLWTPEDLLVAAVNACEMLTFLGIAAKQGLQVLDYASDAKGTLEREDGSFRFTEVLVRPRILVGREEDIPRAQAVLAQSESVCPIAGSLVGRVEIQPLVTVKAADLVREPELAGAVRRESSD